MLKTLKKVEAPRIEIAFALDADKASLADCYMVLHTPDGGPLETVQLDGGPFDNESGMELILEMWSAIGKRFAEPTAKFGMVQPKRKLDG